MIPTDNRGLLCFDSEYKFDLLHKTCTERAVSLQLT